MPAYQLYLLEVGGEFSDFCSDSEPFIVTVSDSSEVTADSSIVSSFA